MQNKCTVYIYEYPEDIPVGTVNDPVRANEIGSCTDIARKKELFATWSLLTGVFSRCYGIAEKEAIFRKNENGKWTAKQKYFSISHKDNTVVLAVANELVGVDVEGYDDVVKMEKYADKILTPKEFKEFETLPGDKKTERLLFLWTAKESIFKREDKKAFIPKNIEAENSITHFSLLPLTKLYGLCVAGDFTEINYIRFDPFDGQES